MLFKKNTFCPRLWEEIFIDKNGDVFSCCHNKPKIIGNIYKQKLKDIYNNRKIQRLRKKSINGKLKCFKNCTLLDKEKIDNKKNNLIIDYNELKRLKILFGEQCNINCIMCWQNHNNKESLDYKKLIENVDISPFEGIEIQGGEPLLIKSAKSFFDYATSKRKKVSFLTNGILINDEWANKIALHSKMICFSINAATKKTHELINKGSKWEIVLRNIKQIKKAKKKHKTDILIKGHMTLVKENLKEIPLFIKNFKKLGFEAINWGFDRSVYSYLKSNQRLKERLKLEIKKELEKHKDKSMINLSRLKILELA